MEFRKGFTPISQPGVCVPLDRNVVSDHAEIVLQTPYGTIASWNISNPIHHYHFGSRPGSSFAQTHMFLDEQFIQQKIFDQVESIASQADVQIIVEGYQNFFDLLQQRLSGLNYALIYEPLPDPTENNTAILVNLQRFTLLTTQVYRRTYLQEGRERTLRVPVVQLMTRQGEVLTVGGVHIPGSSRRSPVAGLQELRSIIEQLNEPLVLMGDFNAIPKLVGDQLPGMRVVLSDYPTHINPGNEVSYYDMALVKGIPNSRMLPLSATSPFTQALVRSIYACRRHLLGETF